MTLDDNSFAEACFNYNSIEELETALLSPPDPMSMSDWGLTADEYYEEIRQALAAKRYWNWN